MTVSESALVLRHRTESIPRGYDTWEGKGDIRTEFIRIDLAGTTSLPVDGLPFMRTMEVDIEFLASTESIALG